MRSSSSSQVTQTQTHWRKALCMSAVQLFLQILQWYEVPHVFTHWRATFCLQAMQLLLQTIQTVEDAHEKAHCKNNNLESKQLWKIPLLCCIIFFPDYIILTWCKSYSQIYIFVEVKFWGQQTWFGCFVGLGTHHCISTYL